MAQKKQVQLRLHPEHARRLKVMSAELDMTMDQLINYLSLLDSVARHGRTGYWRPYFMEVMDDVVEPEYQEMERRNLEFVRRLLGKEDEG